MNFPTCKHRRSKAPQPVGILHWLASEPFRLFFFSGAVWSVIGVALWPLFYAGKLGYYPAYSHARLMIEAFGGAFVVGFLGTAGPRMASAPKLRWWELGWLFLLHVSSAFCHLCLLHGWGDALFALLLMSLACSLVLRVVRFHTESPPPQMLLALMGLACGTAGALLLVVPATHVDPQRLRFANLLLYQGLLLPPVLGIGSFLFPRMLGGGFGEPETAQQVRTALVRASVAAVFIVGSFWVEVWVMPMAGFWMRALTAALYLLLEVRWRRPHSEAMNGSLTLGLRLSLVSGFLGLVMAGGLQAQRVSFEHLLYIGGLGLLMLVVASRVLFGHSGELAGFSRRGGMARWLVGLVLLAAATRAVPGFLPQLTVSHHIYAAITWATVVLMWLGWHRKRFVRRDDE